MQPEFGIFLRGVEIVVESEVMFRPVPGGADAGCGSWGIHDINFKREIRPRRQGTQITDRFAEFGWDDLAGGDEFGQGLGMQFTQECELEVMAGTTLPLAKIAELSGFSDPYNFSRAFRHETAPPLASTDNKTQEQTRCSR